MLHSFLLEGTSEENCLAMLHLALSCNASSLFSKALSIASSNLKAAVRHGSFVWYSTPLDTVVAIIRSAAKQAGRQASDPFEIFQAVVSWVSFNCKCPGAGNKAMAKFIEHIDLPRMKMKELQYLLDEEPMVSHPLSMRIVLQQITCH
mmetsp:Transcript_4537/g.11816  ORF Transcript_4537/g.11816 Transcript_4537/m.11816 type:complete len:148 (+) Transcript_4537:41-484(+)